MACVPSTKDVRRHRHSRGVEHFGGLHGLYQALLPSDPTRSTLIPRLETHYRYITNKLLNDTACSCDLVRLRHLPRRLPRIFLLQCLHLLRGQTAAHGALPATAAAARAVEVFFFSRKGTG